MYRWLPLGTIVNNRVLVVHGGISDSTDLDLIRSLDRSKYVSLLRPPILENAESGTEVIDKVEWKQVSTHTVTGALFKLSFSGVGWSVMMVEMLLVKHAIKWD